MSASQATTGKDDGIFSMPIEKFMTSFATVEFAKP